MKELYCISCFKGVKVSSAPQICPICNGKFTNVNLSFDSSSKESPSKSTISSAKIVRRKSIADILEDEDIELDIPDIRALDAKIISQNSNTVFSAEEIAGTINSPRELGRAKSSQSLEQILKAGLSKTSVIEIQ